jgi:hypothetical protein
MLELTKFTGRCPVCAAAAARHSKSTCMTFRGGALLASSVSGCGPVAARGVPPSSAPHRTARLRR